MAIPVISSSVLSTSTTIPVGGGKPDPNTGIGNTAGLMTVPETELYDDGALAWRPARMNSDDALLTALASNSRSATTACPLLRNYNTLGVEIKLYITAAPNTAETLSIEINQYDVKGTFTNSIIGPTPGYAHFTTPAGSTLQSPNYQFTLIVHPGYAGTPDDATRLKVYELGALGAYWSSRIVHSGASAWTYQVNYGLLV